MKDNLGNRMKNNYEDRFRYKLLRRMPVIIRLDGNSFHSLTKQIGFNKPFDEDFSTLMTNTMQHLCEDIQNVKCAYKQSDEISLLLIDYDTLTTEAWFDYNLQMLSRANFSHKQLENKSTQNMHDMLHDKGINWAELDDQWKNGVFVERVDTSFMSEEAEPIERPEWTIAKPCPIFHIDKNAVEKYLKKE